LKSSVNLHLALVKFSCGLIWFWWQRFDCGQAKFINAWIFLYFWSQAFRNAFLIVMCFELQVFCIFWFEGFYKQLSSLIKTYIIEYGDFCPQNSQIHVSDSILRIFGMCFSCEIWIIRRVDIQQEGTNKFSV
jgi:hypothetical protein